MKLHLGNHLLALLASLPLLIQSVNGDSIQLGGRSWPSRTSPDRSIGSSPDGLAARSPFGSHGAAEVANLMPSSMQPTLTKRWDRVLSAIKPPRNVQGARGVVAHFMVGNAASWTPSDWDDEIAVAKAAKIDGFALNLARNQPSNGPQTSNAFAAAEKANFKLFFSFDYTGNGAWQANEVDSMLQQYVDSSAYYHYDGKALVSTFEGPGNSDDWRSLKAKNDIYFIPDWSSLGAKVAMEKKVADGLFSWAAWPVGDMDMDNFIDASYRDFLKGSPYMMAVSPWFYTNLPGYHKNWLWRGDDLWYDRWMQTLWWQPDLVQIVSWNDYGESHHIGPLRNSSFDSVFGSSAGKARFNYAANMTHDAWRATLPWFIDMYKNGNATVDKETLSVWYRTSPAKACNSDKTTGNTKDQGQKEMSVDKVLQDRIFFDVLAASQPSVDVRVGGVSLTVNWRPAPYGGVGVYHGSAEYKNTGRVEVTAKTNISTMAVTEGPVITNDCPSTGGYANFNPWTGSAQGSTTTARNAMSVYDLACIKGTGPGNYAQLCEYACGLTYCPQSACQCLQLGAPPAIPEATGKPGYPAPGLNATYGGLCDFDCNMGYCPEAVCRYTASSASAASPSGKKNSAGVTKASPGLMAVAIVLTIMMYPLGRIFR